MVVFLQLLPSCCCLRFLFFKKIIINLKKRKSETERKKKTEFDYFMCLKIRNAACVLSRVGVLSVVIRASEAD